MPVFSFFCDHGHETEWIGRLDSKPYSVECANCGSEARFRYTVSKHQGSSLSQRSFTAKAKGLSLHDFECHECGCVFDEIVDNGAGETPSQGKPCPQCGMNANWLPGSKIDRESERYPYFDRGAGRVFRNKQERREWLKMNPNIEAVEGDFDADKELSKMRAQEDRLCAEADVYLDRLEHDPAFRGYRVARDQGRI